MRALVPLFLLLATGASAQEACYADFKASREDPLQLLYGVSEVEGECTVAEAARELGPRIAGDGWQLLEVLSTFGPSGLEERRESAGEYYLRY